MLSLILLGSQVWSLYVNQGCDTMEESNGIRKVPKGTESTGECCHTAVEHNIRHTNEKKETW